MEGRFETLQAQFPASFPDSFKTLFAMVGEDEDHWDMFSTLLEDKVIPRVNRVHDRPFGGSLRCTQTTPSHSDIAGSTNVTRSNSFRHNRPRANTYTRRGMWCKSSGAPHESVNAKSESNKLFCKHIKYCCLHQEQHQTPVGRSAALQMNCYTPQKAMTNDLEFTARADETRFGPDGQDTSDVKHFVDQPIKFMPKPTSSINCRECKLIEHSQQRSSSASLPMNVLPLKPILKNSNKKPQAVAAAMSATSVTVPLTTVAPSLGPSMKLNRQPQHLPRVPKEIGAFHTKEQALQRVQQQFGIFKYEDKTDCSSLKINSLSSMNKSAESVAGIESDLFDRGTTAGAPTDDIEQHQILTSENQTGACHFGHQNTLNQLHHAQHHHPRTTNANTHTNEPDNVNTNYDNKKPIHQYTPITSNYALNQSDCETQMTMKLRNNLAIQLTNIDKLHMHDLSTSWVTPSLKCDENDKKMNTTLMKSYTRNSHKADGAASSTTSDKSNISTTNTAKMTCVGHENNEQNNNNNNNVSKTSGDKPSQVLENVGKKEGSLKIVEENSSSPHDGNDTSTFQDSFIATHSSSTPNAKNPRTRTSSMPVEGRKPRLADMRRTAIHCADMDIEYYRLRSFSITSHGVCNLGDLLRRRSRSNNSVTSTGTSNSGRERHNSIVSRGSGEVFHDDTLDKVAPPAAYKIAMLGSAGVGKTTLSYQFTTSEYICAYDLSLDDDYGQKTVSVLVDNVETDLEIIDHPACEMSVEAFCSTYRIDLFVVVYSVVDRSSFKAAEKILQYLKDNEMLMIRGAILVGNKTDLERHRVVTPQMGRKLAKEIACKFIETSSGLVHNVDELLVGIVAQVKLNSQRINNLSEFDRQRLLLQNCIQEHRHMNLPKRRVVRQMSMHQAHDDDDDDGVDADADDDDDDDTTWDAQFKTADDEATGKENQQLMGSSTQNLVRSKIKERFDYSTMLNERTRALSRSDHAQHLTIVNRAKEHNSAAQSLNNSPKRKNRYDYYKSSSGTSKTLLSTPHLDDESFHDTCHIKSVSKLTDRTKGFFSSVLKFKKAMKIKRRSSSSCSDLFVI